MIYLFIFILGLCIGSFLNVCIWRLPRGQSLLRPASHCPNCQNPIKWYDNIPLLSYSLLKGKCRRCSSPISPRYPLVEALTGTLFLLSLLHYYPITFTLSSSLLLLRDLLFISFLIPIFFIDLENQIIPNPLSYGIIITGLIINIFIHSLKIGTETIFYTNLFSPENGMHFYFPSFLSSLAGMAIGGGLFLAVYFLGSFFLKEESMGIGDIKLAAGIGVFLGWEGMLICFFLSFLLGAVIATTLLLTHLKKRRDKIPFAPFLVGAALISLFLGDKLLHLYLALL